jgi:ABC-type lipoprotein release transport system permease subunit
MNDYDYTSVLQSINMSAIRAHVEYFASLKSRVAGYPGSEAAANYILQSFKAYGLKDAQFEPLNITVPIDYGAQVTVIQPKEEFITAYSLWPNSVQTCSTPGTIGKLIYVESGETDTFNGLDIRGSIVLMDFNSRDLWLNAFKLGAKAVIFIEPEFTTTTECEFKILDVPLNFPRLWVSREDGMRLLNLLEQSEVIVSIRSKMIYETVTVYNVVGSVKGSYYDETDTIAITAHYDSFSYVPSLAPGANDATGISTLLEIARYFSRNTPKRTVKFIAFSGHWQGLAGAREYVNAHFNQLNLTRVFFNLDFSTGSSSLSILDQGYYYRYSGIYGQSVGSRTFAIWKLLTQTFIPNISAQTGKTFEISTPEKVHYIPISYILDIEPINLAGGIGLAYFTSADMRIFQKTPFDTADHVNYENLRPQVEFTFLTMYLFANDPLIGLYSAKDITKTLSRWSDSGGFSTLEGQVVKFELKGGWYVPVPNALVHLTLVYPSTFSTIGAIEHQEYYQQRIVVETDENGKFIVHGVLSVTASYGVPINRYVYIIQPYVVNQTDGKILYASDMGIYGAAKFPNLGVLIDKAVTQKTFVVFECGTILLSDILHPHSFQPASEISLFECPSYAPLVQYGGVISSRNNIAMLFVPRNKTVGILLKDKTSVPFGLLINITENYPEGTGFRVNVGETMNILNTPAIIARDMYALDETRIRSGSKVGIINVEAMEYHQQALNYLNKCRNAIHTKQYDVAFSEAMKAWGAELKTYILQRGAIQDSTLTISVIFALSIPFSFLVNALLNPSQSSVKKMFGLIIILIITIFSLSFAHPSFYVASNTPVVLLGTLVVALTSPLALILFNNLISVLKSLRRKVIGTHFIEVSHVATSSRIISLSIENMKRRKIRTGLTAFTLIAVSYSLTAFTSTASLTITMNLPLAEGAPYSGIYIRNIQWAPLHRQVLEVLEPLKNVAIISPRFWYLPPQQTITLTSQYISIRYEENAAFLALSPEEKEIMNADSLLVDGRWFTKYDLFACILPEGMAEKLKVQPGDQVQVQGILLTVVGIISSDALNAINELDQTKITPIDMIRLLKESGAEIGGFTVGIMQETLISRATFAPRLSAESIVIVPLKFGYMFNYPLYTVTIMFKEPFKYFISEMSSELASATYLDIYASINGSIYAYRKTIRLETGGWNVLILPTLISMLIVVNTMLGSIYERTKEIGILSSLGLSPKHISLIFLSEIGTLALICALVGYITGITTNILLFKTALLPQGFSPNSSSTYVLYSVIFLIVSSFVSSIYPLYKAARMVTPSLERTWKVPTKPKGGEWTIPLPVTLKGDSEVIGIMKFLQEFIEITSGDRSAPFFASNYFIQRETTEKLDAISLIMDVRLAPLDRGIAQKVKLSATSQEGKNEYRLELYIERVSGTLDMWEKVNRQRFLDIIRKQLLLWKTLKPDEKTKYILKT